MGILYTEQNENDSFSSKWCLAVHLIQQFKLISSNHKYNLNDTQGHLIDGHIQGSVFFINKYLHSMPLLCKSLLFAMW